MAYMEAVKHHKGSRKLSSADWDSCERMPLLDLDDLAYVIDVIIIPELHIFTGVFNTLFKRLKEVFEGAEDSTVKALDWSSKHSVSPDGQGVTFVLEELIDGHSLEDELDKIVDAFSSFKNVTELCFGMELKSGYALEIDRFMYYYRQIENLNVSIKVHILEAHVCDFFERQKGTDYEGKGLGFWSE